MWQRAEIHDVMTILEQEKKLLHSAHRMALEETLIAPKRIPVRDCPGESVVAVASIAGKLLYWSDIEEGWELEEPNADGGIESRGCSQFELADITHHAFGVPELPE
jgi:hypothetical protein